MVNDDNHANLSSGIFSGVFNFVSRELESFVVNAGLASPKQETNNQPIASSSRLKLPDKRSRKEPKTLRHDKDVRNRRQPTTSSSKVTTPLPQHEEAYLPNEIRAYQPYPPKRNFNRRRRTLCRTADFSGDEDGPSGNTPLTSTVLSDPSNLSVTMPGSLYTRTKSLEPTPEPDWECVRRVRFSEEVPQFPLDGTRRAKERGYTPHRSLVIDDGSDGDVSSPFIVKTIELVHGREDLRPVNYPNVGSLQTYHHEETNGNVLGRTGEILSKGKRMVYSLSQNNEPEVANPFRTEVEETEREGEEEKCLPQINSVQPSLELHGRGQSVEKTSQSAECRTHTPTPSLRERERDRHRIEMLEEEVRRLREELARRSVITVASCSPPPPPPPPPPPTIPLARFNISASEVDKTLKDVRAALKHTTLPIERPINPMPYGSAPRSHHKGLPTLKIDNDKMAEFLKEMKTHRLRKISNTADGSFVANASSMSDGSNNLPDLDGSLDLSNASLRHLSTIPGNEQLRFTLNRKRELVSDNADSTKSIVERPSKRRQIETPHSMLSKSLPGRQPTDLSFASSNVQFPQPTSNSSQTCSSVTDLYIPTPSLCSDNEVEGGYEDKYPPTPPLISKKPTPISKDQSSLGTSRPSYHIKLTDSKVQMAQGDSVTMRPSGRQTPENKKTRPISASGDAFARRPPKSPMPQDTPRRPRPPSRTKAKNTQVLTDDNLPSIDAALSFIAPQPTPLHNDRFIGLPLSPTIPRQRSHSSSKPEHSNYCPPTTALPAVSMSKSQPKPRRSGTLHDELVRVGASKLFTTSVVAADDDDHELESGVLTASGLRDSRQGFLAHGGGGGIPAIADTGRDTSMVKFSGGGPPLRVPIHKGTLSTLQSQASRIPTRPRRSTLTKEDD